VSFSVVLFSFIGFDVFSFIGFDVIATTAEEVSSAVTTWLRLLPHCLLCL
jgi:amino acid transporter